MAKLKSKRFYVYVIRDPRPGKRKVPIYAGKGQKHRAYDHLREQVHRNPILWNKIAKIRACGLEPIVEKVKHFGDNETQAFAFEKRLIAKFGRIDLGTGTLCNLTDGGEGQAGSLIVITMMKRKWRDPEFRERMIATVKRMQADPNFRTKMKKMYASNEWHEAQGAAVAKLWKDPDFRKRFVARMLAYRADPASGWYERQVALLKRLNADREVQKRVRAGLRRLWSDPAFRKQHASAMELLWSDPAFREKNAKMLRKRNADPDFQRRRIAAVRRVCSDPKWSRRQSALMRRLNADPNFPGGTSPPFSGALQTRNGKDDNPE